MVIIMKRLMITRKDCKSDHCVIGMEILGFGEVIVRNGVDCVNLRIRSLSGGRTEWSSWEKSKKVSSPLDRPQNRNRRLHEHWIPFIKMPLWFDSVNSGSSGVSKVYLSWWWSVRRKREREAVMRRHCSIACAADGRDGIGFPGHGVEFRV